MASPSSVLTRGLGSWGETLMVTLGLGSGAAVIDIPDEIWIAQLRNRTWTADNRGLTWTAANRPKTWVGTD